ncbi:hypothetical protein AZE42_07241 [Rhizopogon vesiculosus]|uniref:DUF6533 domain-containing protein n=1 Tax=Rhizopogon vesiculosus TaxID=180088 RepID=A0A1J8QRB8_9AGAM|nr:hypothetical protein AZE42_07241 [Rhizopogon vesiculosus]
MVDSSTDSVALQTVAVRIALSLSAVYMFTHAYLHTASTAALLFDYTITFSSEVNANSIYSYYRNLTRHQVRWTWRRKWGFTRIVFVVSRYLPFVTLAMTIYYTIESTRGGVPNYSSFSVAYDGVHYSGILAAESKYHLVLLLTRTYVFWGCQRRFLIALVVFTTVIFTAMLGIASMSSSKTGVTTTGVYEDGWNASIMYGLLMFYELFYRRFKVYSMQGNPVIAAVYRDGVVYMLCIALVSMINCIVIVVLPLAYSTLFDGPQIVAHSVLASRIMFNLREANESQDRATFRSSISHPFAFRTPTYTTGNLELEDLVNR